MVSEGRYSLTEVDKQILETDIGEFEVYEGQLVALDCPMFEEEEKKKQPELNKPKQVMLQRNTMSMSKTLKQGTSKKSLGVTQQD